MGNLLDESRALRELAMRVLLHRARRLGDTRIERAFEILKLLLEEQDAALVFGRFFAAAHDEIEPDTLQDDKRKHDKCDGKKIHGCSILCHMPIHETLKQSIPDALRARDEVKLRTLRSLVTAMTNEVVAKKRKPTEFLADPEALAVVKRAASQRKDSIEQFSAAGRTDLAEPEKAELAIIESYLPTMMSRDEIIPIVKAKMAETGVATKAEAGKFTGLVMKELAGRADGADVKAVVDSLLF